MTPTSIAPLLEASGVARSEDEVVELIRGVLAAPEPPDGDAFELTGTFREVDVPSRLAFTFEWEPADPDDEETVAQLALEMIDDSTRVHLRQGPFKTEARCALHRDGWTESFDKLAELVTA